MPRAAGRPSRIDVAVLEADAAVAHVGADRARVVRAVDADVAGPAVEGLMDLREAGESEGIGPVGRVGRRDERADVEGAARRRRVRRPHADGGVPGPAARPLNTRIWWAPRRTSMWNWLAVRVTSPRRTQPSEPLGRTGSSTLTQSAVGSTGPLARKTTGPTFRPSADLGFSMAALGCGSVRLGEHVDGPAAAARRVDLGAVADGDDVDLLDPDVVGLRPSPSTRRPAPPRGSRARPRRGPGR